MERHRTKPLDETKEPRPRKLPYTAPRLTIHGDAHEITLALSGLNTDGQGGSTQVVADGEG